MDIEQLPQEVQPVYTEAKEAGLNGRNGRVKELVQDLRDVVGDYEQAELFA